MTSFFGELRRRNVVKVAVAYAIVGWVLIEVSTTVLPVFEAPDWIAQVFTFFVILGFPLALILSWAYEITPEGIKRERDVAAGESITKVTGRKIDFAIIGALVLTLGFVLYSYVLEDGDVATVGVLPNSVAVLPFANLSPDPDDAYFAAGLHDEILNQLAKLSALNVISRTSVLPYADSGKSIPQIAAELNVQTVMEGTVRYAGDRIRVTTQLIDPVTGTHLWSETYDREFEDIFAIESDIATNVANALQIEFSLAERAQIERRPTDSPAAYALFLEARTMSSVDGTMERIQQLLDQAIDLDPDFASAYAAKATAHGNLLVSQNSTDGVATSDQPEQERLTREYVERALALDESTGEAYQALGALELYSWRWAAAREQFEIGERIGGVALRRLLSLLDSFMGNHVEAVRRARRDAEAHPNNFQFHQRLGWVLLMAGDLDAAVEAVQRSIDLYPIPSYTHRLMAYAELGRGNEAAALQAIRASERLLGDGGTHVAKPELAKVYGQLGQMEDAQRLFAEISAIAETEEIGAGAWATAYLAIGEYERSLEWLRVAVDKVRNHEPDQGFYNLMHLKTNISSHPVLERSEFVEVRRGLEPEE